MSAQRPPMEEMTLRQLRRVASELNISRYSRMRKDQLLNSILEIQQLRTAPNTRIPEAQAPAEFEEGQTERLQAPLTNVSFTHVDETLPDLPSGYGESCIVLMPRDPQWAYAYWDISNASKERLRQQGGIRLALRFYDITNVDIETQRPHSLQQYECDELAKEWYLPVPVSDRDYMIEIGYITLEGRWLMLARSASVRIAPVYPSDWIDDRFITIDWDEDLRSKTFLRLVHPARQLAVASVSMPVYQEAFALAERAESKRSTGSVFGSVQQVPEESISSYVFPSGIGKWASGAASLSEAENMSGVGHGISAVSMSGVGVTSGVGMISSIGAVGMSGVGAMSGISAVSMSGIGTMSGISTMSGIGTMSGISTMSGIGTMSGMGMSSIGATGMSGIGWMSGIGMMETSGIGMMETSGIGMSGIGMSGIGLMSGIGMMETSGIGMSGVGVSGVGMSGVGMSGMSGIGMMSGIGFLGTGMSAIGMSGIGTMSGIGMSGTGMSGIGMSGIGMSGIGFSASMPPIRPRQFWMTADAELIIYGATEVDANVTIAGQPIKLNPDGTFRMQISFQDGEIDLPIMAVAADGEQTRSIHLKFNRETLERRTHSPEESVPEWLS